MVSHNYSCSQYGYFKIKTFANSDDVNQNEYMIDTEQQPQPYSVRLPPSMRRQLEESARASGRSLHAEILLRLGGSLEFSKEENSSMNNDLEERMRQIARQEAMEVVREELASNARKKKPE